MKVEDEFLDVLQNIEAAIVARWRADASIADVDARDAVIALARRYAREAESQGVPRMPLSERAERVRVAVEPVCEWRLGREPGPAEVVPISLDDMVRCLSRLRRSIDMWDKEGGPRGYLSFISDFVR